MAKKLIQEEAELEKRLHRLKEVEAEERQAELDRNRRKEELMQHERGESSCKQGAIGRQALRCENLIVESGNWRGRQKTLPSGRSAWI